MNILEKRLLEKILITSSDCWEWQGNLYKGYGRVKINYKSYPTHRLSAHIYKGFSLESSKFICHHCDNKKCCNPGHLYIGDHKTNMRDVVDRKLMPSGINNHNSKLNLKKVIEIKELLSKNISQRVIAAKFKVSRNCIAQIHHNKTWRKDGNTESSTN